MVGFVCAYVCISLYSRVRAWAFARVCEYVSACVFVCVKKVIATSVIPVLLSAGVFVWNWHRMTVLLKQPHLQIVPAVTALIYSALKFTTRMRLHPLISRE